MKERKFSIFHIHRRFCSRCLMLMLISATIISVCSCTKAGREADLSMSANLANTSEWCVISVPYAAFKEEPASQSEVINHGRRSDIFEVTGKKYVTVNKQTVLWYQFDKGWLPETSVMIYENKLKAQTAAGSMNE